MFTSVLMSARHAVAQPKARVLVLGDSVFHAFTHVDSAAEIMNKSQPTLFATQGCQRLVVEGCMAFAKLSALQQLRRYSGQFTDVVVVGTGYNDRLGPEFKAAVLAITDEAKEQGVDVLWVTYREVRHVRGKAKVMNEQLARLDQRIEHLHIADWNAFSSDSNDWFRSDRLHLVTLGAEKLAELLNTEIAAILANERRSTWSKRAVARFARLAVIRRRSTVRFDRRDDACRWCESCRCERA